MFDDSEEVFIELANAQRLDIIVPSFKRIEIYHAGGTSQFKPLD